MANSALITLKKQGPVSPGSGGQISSDHQTSGLPCEDDKSALPNTSSLHDADHSSRIPDGLPTAHPALQIHIVFVEHSKAVESVHKQWARKGFVFIKDSLLPLFTKLW